MRALIARGRGDVDTGRGQPGRRSKEGSQLLRGRVDGFSLISRTKVRLFLPMLSISPLLAALSVLTLILLSRLFLSKKHAPLPPGPKRLPLIGNLLDMPSEQEWLTFTRWGEKWGPSPIPITRLPAHQTCCTVFSRRHLLGDGLGTAPHYRQLRQNRSRDA